MKVRLPPSRSIMKVVGCSSLNNVLFFKLLFQWSKGFWYRAVDISLKIKIAELSYCSELFLRAALIILTMSEERRSYITIVQCLVPSAGRCCSDCCARSTSKVSHSKSSILGSHSCMNATVFFPLTPSGKPTSLRFCLRALFSWSSSCSRSSLSSLSQSFCSRQAPAA